MSGRRPDRRAVHSAPYAFTTASTASSHEVNNTEADIPASLHALDFAYKDLKKRYNELNVKNVVLMKQLKHGGSIEDSKGELFFPNGPPVAPPSSLSAKGDCTIPGFQLQAQKEMILTEKTAAKSEVETQCLKLLQEKQDMQDQLSLMHPKFADLEYHNEHLMKEAVLMKNKLKQAEEDKTRLEKQNKRLEIHMRQNDSHQQQLLLSHMQRETTERGLRSGEVPNVKVYSRQK